jgi:hypothetical protein
MAFTQKHYEALADVIHEQRVEVKAAPAFTDAMQEHDLQLINKITLKLCKVLKQDNPRFKEFTFIAACNRDLA